MFSRLILIVFLSIGFVEGIPETNETCEAQVSRWSESDPCAGTIIVSRSCESASLHFEKTPYESCDAVYFMWSYPMNNLTMIIETPFSPDHQSYSILLRNLPDYDIRKYLIIDGKETEIQSKEEIITLHSDFDYQIQVKFQADTTISYYGFPISYNVTKT